MNSLELTVNTFSTRCFFFTDCHITDKNAGRSMVLLRWSKQPNDEVADFNSLPGNAVLLNWRQSQTEVVCHKVFLVPTRVGGLQF